MSDENTTHSHILDNGYLLYNTIYQNRLHEQDTLYTWTNNDTHSAGLYQEKGNSNLILEVYLNSYDFKIEQVKIVLKHKIRLLPEYFSPKVYGSLSSSSSSLEMLVNKPITTSSVSKKQFSLRFVGQDLIIVNGDSKSLIVNYSNGQFRQLTIPIRKGTKPNQINILFSYDEKYIVQEAKLREELQSFNNAQYVNNENNDNDNGNQRNHTETNHQNYTEENKETYITTQSSSMRGGGNGGGGDNTFKSNNKNTIGTIDTEDQSTSGYNKKSQQVRKTSIASIQETKPKRLTRTYLFIPINNAIYYAIIKDNNMHDWDDQFTFNKTIIKIKEEETIKDLKILRLFESKDCWYYLFLVLTDKTYYEIVSDWCNYSLRSIIINNSKNYNKLKSLQYSFDTMTVDYYKIIVDYKKDSPSYIYLFLGAKVFKFDFDWSDKVYLISERIRHKTAMKALDTYDDEEGEYSYYELQEVKGQFSEVCVCKENIIVYNKNTHRLFFYYLNNTVCSQSSDEFAFVKFVSFPRIDKVFFITNDSMNKIIFSSKISNYPLYWIDSSLRNDDEGNNVVEPKVKEDDGEEESMIRDKDRNMPVEYKECDDKSKADVNVNANVNLKINGKALNSNSKHSSRSQCQSQSHNQSNSNSNSDNDSVSNSTSNNNDQTDNNSFKQTPNTEKIIIHKDLYDIVKTIKSNYSKKSPYDSLCQYCNSQSEKIIYCKDCHSSYCSTDHLRQDAKYHFFHCKLKSFFQYYHYQSTKTFYKELIQLLNDIIKSIFNNINSKEDYKAYIPFIKLLTELLRMLNVKQIEETLFDINKGDRAYAQEVLFWYYNLILLYLNFAIKSDMITFVNKEIERAIEKKWFYSQKNGQIANFRPEYLIYKNNKSETANSSYIWKRYDKGYGNNQSDMLRHNSKDKDKSGDLDKDKELVISEIDMFVSHMIHVFSNFINIIRHIRSKLSYANNFNVITNANPNSLCIVLSDLTKSLSDIIEERPFESKDNLALTYFYLLIAPYLVSIKKTYAAEKALKKAVASLSDREVSPLNVVLLFNLGLIQFTNGLFNEGIHHMESSYRLISLNNYSFHMKIYVVEKLALAYINIRELMKAFLLLKEALSLRSSITITTPENSMRVIHLKTIINYIKDFVEYEFKVCHIGDKEKEKGLMGRDYAEYLIAYVLGMHDKRKKSLFDFYSEDYFKATEFFHNLTKDILMKINNDNQLKKKESGVFKEDHNAHEKSPNQSAINDLSSMMLPQANDKEKEKEKEKEEEQVEYEEEIDIKENVFDLICRQDQLKLSGISNDFISRSIILRDCYGPIDHFNINYDPNYTKEFRAIVEEGKHHLFIKEFTYSKTSRLDNYFSNKEQNYLDGLSKYMLQDEIQTMFLVEQSRLYSQSVSKTNRVGDDSGKEKEKDTLCYTEATQESKGKDAWVQLIKGKILKNKDICLDNIERAIADLYDILNEEYLEQISETPEMILNYIFCDVEARENNSKNTMPTNDE